jgi:hypothetical protein
MVEPPELSIVAEHWGIGVNGQSVRCTCPRHPEQAELVASRSCRRMASASSAEAGAISATAIGLPFWPCFRPWSTPLLAPSTALFTIATQTPMQDFGEIRGEQCLLTLAVPRALLLHFASE